MGLPTRWYGFKKGEVRTPSKEVKLDDATLNALVDTAFDLVRANPADLNQINSFFERIRSTGSDIQLLNALNARKKEAQSLMQCALESNNDDLVVCLASNHVPWPKSVDLRSVDEFLIANNRVRAFKKYALDKKLGPERINKLFKLAANWEKLDFLRDAVLSQASLRAKQEALATAVVMNHVAVIGLLTDELNVALTQSKIDNLFRVRLFKNPHHERLNSGLFANVSLQVKRQCLMKAVLDNNIDAAQILLREHQVPPDGQAGTSNATLLPHAQSIEMLELLLAYGANAQARNIVGIPAHYQDAFDGVLTWEGDDDVKMEAMIMLSSRGASLQHHQTFIHYLVYRYFFWQLTRSSNAYSMPVKNEKLGFGLISNGLTDKPSLARLVLLTCTIDPTFKPSIPIYSSTQSKHYYSLLELFRWLSVSYEPMQEFLLLYPEVITARQIDESFFPKEVTIAIKLLAGNDPKRARELGLFGTAPVLGENLTREQAQDFLRELQQPKLRIANVPDTLPKLVMFLSKSNTWTDAMKQAWLMHGLTGRRKDVFELALIHGADANVTVEYQEQDFGFFGAGAMKTRRNPVVSMLLKMNDRSCLHILLRYHPESVLQPKNIALANTLLNAGKRGGRENQAAKLLLEANDFVNTLCQSELPSENLSRTQALEKLSEALGGKQSELSQEMQETAVNEYLEAMRARNKGPYDLGLEHLYVDSDEVDKASLRSAYQAFTQGKEASDTLLLQPRLFNYYVSLERESSIKAQLVERMHDALRTFYLDRAKAESSEAQQARYQGDSYRLSELDRLCCVLDDAQLQSLATTVHFIPGIDNQAHQQLMNYLPETFRQQESNRPMPSAPPAPWTKRR